MSRPPPDPLHILHSESGSVTALHSFGAKFPELLVSGSETGHITIWSLKVEFLNFFNAYLPNANHGNCS